MSNEQKAFEIMKRHRIGKHMQACMLFANTYRGWHSFSKDSRTRGAVTRLHRIGLLEVNQYGQFRSIKYASHKLA